MGERSRTPSAAVLERAPAQRFKPYADVHATVHVYLRTADPTHNT